MAGQSPFPSGASVRWLAPGLPPERRSRSATYRTAATTMIAGKNAGTASRIQWWARYSTCGSVIVVAYPGGPHILRPLPYFEHRFIQAAMTSGGCGCAPTYKDSGENLVTQAATRPTTDADDANYDILADILGEARQQVLERGEGLGCEQVLQVLQLPDDRLDELLALAHE